MKPHFSATCLAAEVEFGCGSVALFSSENASCSGGGLGGPAYKKQFADADLFSRTHARKIHCTPSRNPDAKTAAKRLWSRLEVAQPLLAVRRVARSTRGLHRQECLCHRTRHSKPNQPTGDSALETSRPLDNNRAGVKGFLEKSGRREVVAVVSGMFSIPATFYPS